MYMNIFFLLKFEYLMYFLVISFLSSFSPIHDFENFSSSPTLVLITLNYATSHRKKYTLLQSLKTQYLTNYQRINIIEIIVHKPCEKSRILHLWKPCKKLRKKLILQYIMAVVNNQHVWNKIASIINTSMLNTSARFMISW